MDRVGIIDVGVGNLIAIDRMLQKIGRFSVLIREPDDFQQCDALIIPGVGSAPGFLNKLRDRKLDQLIIDLAGSDVKILGICLGMQILGGINEEADGQPGLGCVPFRVVNNVLAGGMPSHTGWMSLPESGRLRHCIGSHRVFFNHRYTCIPDAELDYDPLFSKNMGIAYVQYKNFYCMQFHPEKSQTSGLSIMNSIVGGI